MTPTSPQKEYIITGEQVCDITRFNEHGLKTLQHDIRSRPYLAQQNEKDRIFALLSDSETRKEIVDRLSQPWSIEVLNEIKKIHKSHDAAIRNATLDDIESFCKSNTIKGAAEQWDSGYNTGMGDVMQRCKVIRRSTPKEQK